MCSQKRQIKYTISNVRRLCNYEVPKASIWQASTGNGTNTSAPEEKIEAPTALTNLRFKLTKYL